jgi:hypothetical protein
VSREAPAVVTNDATTLAEAPPVTASAPAGGPAGTGTGTGAESDLPGAPPDSPPRRSWLAWLLALCAYLPLAALAYWPVWTHWSSQLNGCNCWDQLLLEWFIHWTPSAVTQGHSVLVTNYIDAPGGVNLMWNTSVVTLGALGAPLTQTIGVVHTMSILMTLSLALSASTMFVLLRRWTRWLPAAWLGGLVYGFSTFAVAEAAGGRITFVFDAIPPLLVLTFYKLVKEESSPITAGSVLGVLLAAQLFASEELLTVTALFAVSTLIVLAVLYRRAVLQRSSDVLRAAAAAGVTFLVLAAYPLYIQFRGPERITGPPQTHQQMALFSSDLASLVTPGTTQLLTFGWSNRIANAFSAAAAGEVTEYIGIPLLLLLVACVVLLHRKVLVRIFAPVALFSFWCSMGPRLFIGNDQTGIRGVDTVLVHLPILGDIIPSRFALAFWFSVAVLFGVALDEGYSWLQRAITDATDRRAASYAERPPTRAQLSRRRVVSARLAGVAALVVGIGVLIPITPAWPYNEVPADVPTFFTTNDVQQIQPASLVATYPYPLTAMAWPMLWQADTNMRFRMLGGYAIGPGADGVGTFFPDSNTLEYCFLGIFTKRDTSNCGDPAALRASLDTLGVTSVIAGNDEPNVDLARSVMNRALGARPRTIGGVSLWQCVPVRAGTSCRWR